MSQPPQGILWNKQQRGTTHFWHTTTLYKIWYSGCTYSINTYFKIYTQFKPLWNRVDTEVNGIRVTINTKEISNFTLEMEDGKGKIHNIRFEQVYYFPGVPKLLVRPQKWSRDRLENELGRKGTYLKVIVKHSACTLNSSKSQSTIIYAHVYDLPETSINQDKEGLTKFYRMFVEFFKEWDKVHAFLSVAMTQHKGEPKQPSPQRRGHRHGGQQLEWNIYHDTSINLSRLLWQKVVTRRP